MPARKVPILANLTILLVFLVAAALHTTNEKLYESVVTEDGFLEWATFWAFVVAAAIFFRSAVRQIQAGHGLPWFAVGLSIFCFFVAMEEISWGQRVIGYAAPSFFLEQNYQQEFNLHNVFDTDLRTLAVQVVLLGYGAFLGAVSVVPRMRRRLRHLRVVIPPPQLVMSFLTMSAIYAWYPWTHTGEWVELTMGIAFVFVAVSDSSDISFGEIRAAQLLQPLVALTALAGFTIIGLRISQSADPEKVAQAELEVSALAKDFSGPHLHTRCSIHKRLYTFAIEYGQSFIFDGEFSALARDVRDNRRAEFILDPWNSAYWVIHSCTKDREARFVYSFGPNRRRDSTDWEIGGDDVGAYLPN